MIDELENLAPGFGGSAGHTRCFLHIINLVAKSLLRLFDVKKKKDVDVALEAALTGLAEIGAGLESEENEMAGELDGDDEDGGDIDDNDAGWIDERAMLSAEEQAELEDSILPIKLALVKVCRDNTGLPPCSLVPLAAQTCL